MPDDEYIGVALAVCSSVAIGSSYVTTKIGLKDASERHGFKGDGHEYLHNRTWWTGMIMLVVGELFNFAAYAFAPAVLVTPLGALSVLTGTVLGAHFLNERLGLLGKMGCALCLLGSVLIVANAPADRPIETVDEILEFAIQPGFLFFCLLSAIFSVFMIYTVCPRYGTQNPLYYLSVCAVTGAVSVMSLKAFGIAIKLTFAGMNQFTHASTYVFALVATLCIVTQMNYFNKALSTFPQSIVSPMYYVTFTTAVLTASFILFQGFNVTDTVETLSLLCGFIVIFLGVYLLNFPENRHDEYSLVDQRFVNMTIADDQQGRTSGIEDLFRPSDESQDDYRDPSMRSQRHGADGYELQVLAAK
ncbi:magnesium transporter [Amylocarpus encephaloides]|uniref:Magnesium transporter n=1 Tax=Amylocarpus encephaloides TaxID=45428 RepID=A0A9P7YMR7_9HELO|nr:magnesium transporter [Amylocarpus encephaloides]